MAMTIPRIEFDVDSFRVALTNHIVLVLQNAIKAFIRKAVSKVPVDRGMARGTFLNLAEVLGETVPINPKPYKRVTTYKQAGKGTVDRLPESGRLFSTVFASLADVVKVNGDNIEFEFSNDLLYYYLNENGLIYGPWDSYPEGEAELLKYFNENILTGSPDIEDFLVTTYVTIE